MSQEKKYWQILSSNHPPYSFIESFKSYVPELSGKYLAQLLWQRGIKNPEDIASFLDPKQYKPASFSAFGSEINNAVARIISARNNQEKVAIWGDFDADGITSTSVLWDGLGEFLDKIDQLTYYIPNRFIESHGLNFSGIERLAKKNYSLIITCDTGSTNIAEIEYANSLGIDIIVTDHHTILTKRPPLFAIINPRYFSQDHPLYNLSGVGVAYKLIEALYLTHPEIPQLPLTELLDLVAIGLIADLVELRDDCRYLAQIGIEKLRTQLHKTTRPGVAKLLELCQKTGDRPTDISFGIGPRINAVSRIMGEASFCVELLTSRNPQHCQKLALQTELANSRRKSLEKEVAKDIAQKLTKLDLSTTHVIVLSDPQWPVGVLGLVAGQIAQKYGRPTILFSEETEVTKTSEKKLLARGSARSVGKINLYELVKNQAHLLHNFGGHPFAAGLSLPVENISIFTDAINQLLGEILGVTFNQTSVIEVDLIITVSELGRDLFQELKLLEPCGMGNPVPKLLIQNCWFTDIWHQNQTDMKGNKVRYIKTNFEICDKSIDKGFPGIWWGHYKEEIPSGRCDAVVELDFNAKKKCYEARLIAVQPNSQDSQVLASNTVNWILDWRNNSQPLFENKNSKFPNKNYSDTNESKLSLCENEKDLIVLAQCPTSWNDLRIWFRRAINQQKKLAIAYSQPFITHPLQIWQQLLGIAKYLSRTGQPVTPDQLVKKLSISDTTLKLGLIAIQYFGFNVKYKDKYFYIIQSQSQNQKLETLSQTVQKFLAAVSEEQFREKYFCEVPLKIIEAIAIQTILEDANSSIPF
ncbi:MAG: single-stranded-DNA-specific exonuclease RecJ [Trichodesmium sp. MAG_R01]|nr:single-stranded-DNA-specific exonuclease RecJ [Trichodesmium sp. MAG_R01]